MCHCVTPDNALIDQHARWTWLPSYLSSVILQHACECKRTEVHMFRLFIFYIPPQNVHYVTILATSPTTRAIIPQSGASVGMRLLLSALRHACHAATPSRGVQFLYLQCIQIPFFLLVRWTTVSVTDIAAYTECCSAVDGTVRARAQAVKVEGHSGFYLCLAVSSEPKTEAKAFSCAPTRRSQALARGAATWDDARPGQMASASGCHVVHCTIYGGTDEVQYYCCQ